MTTQILISGFGGQGVLFTGKFLAYKGLVEDKQVSWLPSYGPEMRGGTASCSIIISDEPVGSPIVSNPDILVAMNIPSLDRYEDSVVPSGVILYDSSLIDRAVKRTDVTAYAVPATKLAIDNNIPTLANMILGGKLLSVMNGNSEAGIQAALAKVISAKHANMLDANLKAIQLGANFE